MSSDEANRDRYAEASADFASHIGDKVLIHFANTLQSVIRINDFAARMGGEEFVVIAPRIDEISVKMLGERIQTEVERNQPVALNLGRLITVSVGAAIADLSIDTDGWASTLKRSDQAVYAAKAAGRNTFKLHKNLQHRKHERIASKLEITIRNLSDQSDKQLKTSLSNFSQGGAFINHHAEWRPEQGQVLEVFIENQCKSAQVLRVTPIGYAVEFLNL
jgi:diguanylate cyclase (GGDEF)-like protein